jgi:subtilase family serine protease
MSQRSALLALAIALGTLGAARAQTSAPKALLSAPVDERQLVTLGGNTRPEATAANDRGAVPDAYALPHLQLLLKRPPEREAALQSYIAQLHDRTSPNYHRWLNAAEFRRRYGLADQDLTMIAGWLQHWGFIVNNVYANAALIDFSGTAGQVREAFRTEIHAFSVGGARHFANVRDPSIPAALAPAVAGVVSLHDFRPHPLKRARAAYTVSSSQHLVVPEDLATIYNLAPLFAQGISGQGQTIVVIEDTDLYRTGDWATFRSVLGLSSYASGTLVQLHPAPSSGPTNCNDPGVVSGGVDEEAILDAEWASAAAPSAAIELAACADSGATFGGLIALQNLINQSGSPPAIMSISYGECEAEDGATANAAYASAYEQAVTEGVSIFVAAGDSGAAGCDPSSNRATHGIGVNAFASTAYNVAVGGTDFEDSYDGKTASYWSPTNSGHYGSALSYVPEIPWNDSCASLLISSIEGYAAPYGSAGFCNSAAGEANFLTTTAGGGGPSGCATGIPTTLAVVSGTCAGTPKPSWQAGVPGNPNDGVRDLPDVSLFSGNGVWGHYFVVCWSDAGAGGAACTGAPNTWSGAGGTSFAAPIMAGIQALVNQSTGSAQGNPNFEYYTLSSSQYASQLSCNASSGIAASSGCVFYDVTQGDMDVNCQGLGGHLHNCYLPSGSYGVVSNSKGANAPAYPAASGWDFASGIGSVNAYNLVYYWLSADISLSASGTVTPQGFLSYSLVVADHGPQSANGVVVNANVPVGFTLVSSSSSSVCTQTGQTISCMLGALALGATAPLSLVINPGDAAQTVNVSFNASSNQRNLNPSDGMDTIGLNLPTNASSDTDAPLPLWSEALLGAGLAALLIYVQERRQRAHTASQPAAEAWPGGLSQWRKLLRKSRAKRLQT